MTSYIYIALAVLISVASGKDNVIRKERALDRQLADDYTFLLVHNLSQVDINNLLPSQQPPIPSFQPQLITLIRPQKQKPKPKPTTEVNTQSEKPNSKPEEPTTTPAPTITTTLSIPTTTPTPEVTTPTEEHSIPQPSEVCGVRGGSQDTRIVGGANADPNEFPWQVSLQLVSGPRARHICGGAVLTRHWIITAAHCIWELKPSMLSIVAGDHDLYTVEGNEQRSGIARIVVNKYKRETFTNDIALLQLTNPLKIDHKHVQAICLPDPHHKFLKGDSIVTGWGRLSESGALPHVLQHLTLPILSLKRCHSLYRKAGYTKYIHGCQLCSGYEQGGLDSCQGDSGGPLVCKQADGRYYLCGIVSWGVGCARPKFPGVYTEVTCFVDWVKHIINNQGNLLANAPAVVSISPSNYPEEGPAEPERFAG